MSDEPKMIFAKRLEQARKMQGLSLRALAEKLQGAVTASAIQKYESAQMLPSSTVLIALGRALGQNPDYFFRPPGLSIEKIEFRKRSKLLIKDQQSVQERARDFFERYLEVEQIVGLDAPFKNPLEGTEIRSPEEIEIAAKKLREAWSLGRSPLPNVLELLEDHYIKVFELDAHATFDGMCGWAGDLPVIVVNKAFPAVRKRLTALHELGHLLLKFPDGNKIEHLCHAFAGAMLIPGEVFVQKFGGKRSTISWNELFEIKKEYGISLGAIMARARNLGLISQDHYVRFNIQLNKKGWRLNEPGHFNGQEESHRFQQLVFRAAANELVSLSKAASLAGQSLAAFRESLQLVA